MKTVNLELSKKLKESGYPQIGDRYFVKRKDIEDALLVNYYTHDDEQWETFLSPTADEILDQLPASIRFKVNKKNEYIIIKREDSERITDKMIFLTLRKDYDTQEYLIEYYSNDSFLSGGSKPDLSDATWSGDSHNTLCGYKNESLSDAVALMWLYLKKENLL